MPNVDVAVSQGSINAIASTQNLNHAANVLIIVDVARTGAGVPPASVTAGGVAAVMLVQELRLSRWLVYREPAANDPITVTWAAITLHQWLAASFTNTLDTAPFYDASAINTGFGVHADVVVPVGTAGRMIVQTTFALGLVNLSPDPGQTEIILMPGTLDEEMNYLNAAAASNMGTVVGGPATWFTIGTGIIDSSQDLLWKRRRK